MPFITANRIHNGYKWLPEGTVIEVADDGTIIALHDSFTGDTKVYEGDIMPGFVNVHCHLELSHLKGVVPEHTGLVPFLQAIPVQRNNFTEYQKQEARHAAYNELVMNGVVAIGDIANTTDTLDLRDVGRLHFFTFNEAIGFTDANATKSFEIVQQNFAAFEAQQAGEKRLWQVIVPHAPYSVSKSLFQLIDADKDNRVLSIHNQESEDENNFYKNKTGKILDLLEKFGIEYGAFMPSGKSSLCSYVPWFASTHPMIFVHNTYTNKEDIVFAQQKFDKTFWCLCPNANLYIEDKLPDIQMFINEHATICIGTDSLASNNSLNILSELQTIKKYYPAISWEILLSWATINGAQALQMDDILGSIDVGKKPGIIQVIRLEDSIEQPMINRLFS